VLRDRGFERGDAAGVLALAIRTSAAGESPFVGESYGRSAYAEQALRSARLLRASLPSTPVVDAGGFTGTAVCACVIGRQARIHADSKRS